MKGFERKNAIKIEKKVKDNKRKRKEKKGVFHLSMLSNIKSNINFIFF